MNPINAKGAINRGAQCSALAGFASRQRGVVLLVSLIVLILMTLLVVSAFNLSKSNFQITGNAQRQNEALLAAHETIEAAISTTRLFENPSNIFLVPCTVANTKCVDSTGNGTIDVTVTLKPTPACVKAIPIKNAALNLTDPEDLGCAVGAMQDFGVAGGHTGDSLCADSLWQIDAVAVDEQSQASVTVTEGVAVRVSTDSIATFCP